MNYLNKNFRELFNSMPNMDCSYQKPGTCPHCGFNCDAKHINQSTYIPTNVTPRFAFLVLQCTACNGIFTASYKIENKHAELCHIYPKTITAFKDPLIEEISPKFIKIYNQALSAKDSDNFELAAIGYRTALEILIKDYAIKELNEPFDDVANKKLFAVIKEYLPADELLKTADVVRILGNDYTHYEQKHSEIDFELLQQYMDIFIKLIKTKLLIAHPPVHR